MTARCARPSLVTAVFAASAIIARSSLMMALAVLALAACLGARTGYMHAMYSLSIQEPTITIVLFSALGARCLSDLERLKADYERMAITAARVSLLLVNFGFWIGSLWGDRLTLCRHLAQNGSGPAGFTARGAVIPDYAFSDRLGAWRLLAVGIWGARENRRWVVNLAAVFGGIHFYTQWF